jgi:hypothetical protein
MAIRPLKFFTKPVIAERKPHAIIHPGFFNQPKTTSSTYENIPGKDSVSLL